MLGFLVHQQMLQHHLARRIFHHDDHFVGATAHRRGAFVARLEQHGFVEGKVHGVLALHRQDAGTVTLGIGGSHQRQQRQGRGKITGKRSDHRKAHL